MVNKMNMYKHMCENFRIFLVWYNIRHVVYVDTFTLVFNRLIMLLRLFCLKPKLPFRDIHISEVSINILNQVSHRLFICRITFLLLIIWFCIR